MRKFRTDIPAQGFYNGGDLREFNPGQEVSEEEIRIYGIYEHLLEPINEEEILKAESEKYPHLGEFEIPKEEVKPVKKKGRPKGSKNKKKTNQSERADLDWLKTKEK